MQIKEFIRENSNSIKTLVEIGAHFGTDTMEFRKILPNSKIISFEPDPRNIKVIKENWSNKDIAHLYEFAISNYNGKTEFYLSSGDCSHWCNDDMLLKNDWSASNSIKKPKNHLNLHKWVKFNEKIEIDCIRLDDFEPLKEDIIDFIWADVQGAEDLVFDGARETLKRTRYVYTEYNQNELYENQLTLDGIINLFGPNWKIVQIYSDDVLLKNITFADEDY